MSARLCWLVAGMLGGPLIAGCEGGDSSDDAVGVAASELPAVETDVGDDQTAPDDAEPEPAGTSTTEPEPDPALPLPDAPVINQLTDTDGGGARPLLAWEPVVGAATYYVVVYTEARAPYWAAVTTEPEVYVGGPVQIPDDRDGPRVAALYTWVVYADDADGTPLASSPLRSLSP